MRAPRLTLLWLTAGPLVLLPSYIWAYSLTGASATPTVVPGDTFIVNKAAYSIRLPYSDITLLRSIAAPKRGDIVQAHLRLNGGITAIKRVVGLPGETIEVRENLIFINGRPLGVQPLPAAHFAWVPVEASHMGPTVFMEDHHWAAYTPGKSQYRNSPPRLLRPAEYFLMGDNRDDSLDSRAFGPISLAQITGKVIAVFPKDRHRPVYLGQ